MESLLVCMLFVVSRSCRIRKLFFSVFKSVRLQSAIIFIPCTASSFDYTKDKNTIPSGRHSFCKVRLPAAQRSKKHQYFFRTTYLQQTVMRICQHARVTRTNSCSKQTVLANVSSVIDTVYSLIQLKDGSFGRTNTKAYRIQMLDVLKKISSAQMSYSLIFCLVGRTYGLDFLNR